MKKRLCVSGALTAATLSGLMMVGPVFAEDLSEWVLPPVPVPKENPQNEAKIALGHRLAFDVRLSKNNSISCAGCHLPFAGGGGHTPRAFGHGGELGRWAPSWVNAAFYTSQFWDGRAASLEEQTGALPGHGGPISAAGEMGNDVEGAVKRVAADPSYRKAFKAAFNDDVSRENIAKAIASYERTLIATDAPFQHYAKGDEWAISSAAKRGFELFRGKAMCVTCHAPPLTTDNLFHNIGVPQVGPLKEDLGRYEVTKRASDKRAFKTPSLYNSASFSFFMHDGALSTMKEVIEHYNKGGDPTDPNQDLLMRPLKLSDQEISDLVIFMKTLTDDRLNHVAAPEME